MLADQRRSLYWAAALLGATVTVLVVVALFLPAVQVVDDWFYELMERTRSALLTWIARGLDILGGAYVMWPLRVVVVGWLVMRRYWARLLVFVLAVATSEASIGFLKAAYDRPRPPGSLVATSGASFPSGHAIAAAATVIALVIVVFPPGKERRRWEYLAGTFAFLMALSRTYLRAHWLSDVVAGTLVGLTFAVGSAAIVQSITRRRRARPAPASAASFASPATPGT